VGKADGRVELHVDWGRPGAGSLRRVWNAGFRGEWAGVKRKMSAFWSNWQVNEEKKSDDKNVSRGATQEPKTTRKNEIKTKREKELRCGKQELLRR